MKLQVLYAGFLMVCCANSVFGESWTESFMNSIFRTGSADRRQEEPPLSSSGFFFNIPPSPIPKRRRPFINNTDIPYILPVCEDSWLCNHFLNPFQIFGRRPYRFIDLHNNFKEVEEPEYTGYQWPYLSLPKPVRNCLERYPVGTDDRFLIPCYKLGLPPPQETFFRPVRTQNRRPAPTQNRRPAPESSSHFQIFSRSIKFDEPIIYSSAGPDPSIKELQQFSIKNSSDQSIKINPEKLINRQSRRLAYVRTGNFLIDGDILYVVPATSDSESVSPAENTTTLANGTRKTDDDEDITRVKRSVTASDSAGSLFMAVVLPNEPHKSAAARVRGWVRCAAGCVDSVGLRRCMDEGKTLKECARQGCCQEVLNPTPRHKDYIKGLLLELGYLAGGFSVDGNMRSLRAEGFETDVRDEDYPVTWHDKKLSSGFLRVLHIKSPSLVKEFLMEN